jgi:hypothetical protein
MQALTLLAFALAAVSLCAWPSLAKTAFVSNENGNSVSVMDCAAGASRERDHAYDPARGMLMRRGG